MSSWILPGPCGFYKEQIGPMRAASAVSAASAAASWREILFVPAVRAGRVFQQDIPTEGEVNYEQTRHKGIRGWI